MRVRQLAILGLDLVGWAASAYLTYTHVAHVSPMCGEYGGCSYVQSSPYAQFMGVPVALLGLAAYTVLFILGILAFRGGDNSDRWLLLLLTLAAVGTFYSAYLTYIEAFVLHAYCFYCVTQAIAITLMTILLVVEYLSPEPLGNDGP
ncbi:MAG: vitamin K epoxide reductase family protein [Chloroflexi bacterium]|nr:vitamin K epoxide reductase family protein [Chloroflexota bacterium]